MNDIKNIIEDELTDLKNNMIDYYNRHLLLGLGDDVWYDGYQYTVVNDNYLKLISFDDERTNEFIESKTLFISEIFSYVDDEIYNVLAKYMSITSSTFDVINQNMSMRSIKIK